MCRAVSRALSAICLIVISTSATAHADPQFQLRIADRDIWVGQGIVIPYTYGQINDTVRFSVWADRVSGPANQVGGFDFTVCYDPAALTFLSVVRGGDLHPDWEYFSQQLGSYGDSCAACPKNWVRVYGLTNTVGGIDPAEEAYDLNGSIAEIAFRIVNNPALEGTCPPLGFCTYDCTDNVISSRDGHILYFPAFGITPSPVYDSASCRAVDPDNVLPEIGCYPGGVCILPPANLRGDINLNGVSYEFADWILFSDFIRQGSGTFSAATYADHLVAAEVDCDGITATPLDVAYHASVIAGTNAPCAGNSAFEIDTVNGPVDSDSDTLNIPNATAAPGDTFALDITLANTDTLGAFSFRLTFDPSLLEPVLTDTSFGPDGDTLYSVSVELLRGSGTILEGAGRPGAGELTFLAAAPTWIPGMGLLPGSAPTIRTWWRVKSGASVPQPTLIHFTDDPELNATYNSLADIRAQIWKRPILRAGIVIIDNIPSACACPFQSDFDMSASVDAVDLASAIDIIFFGATETTDLYCPRARADFNADGASDAVDLASLIDHVFFGGSGPVDPCDP